MARQSNLPPTLAPLGVTVPVAAAYLSLSPGKFMQLVERGLMPKPKRIDGRLICDIEDVRAAFKALPSDDDDQPTEQPNPWDAEA